MFVPGETKVIIFIKNNLYIKEKIAYVQYEKSQFVLFWRPTIQDDGYCKLATFTNANCFLLLVYEHFPSSFSQKNLPAGKSGNTVVCILLSTSYNSWPNLITKIILTRKPV